MKSLEDSSEVRLLNSSAATRDLSPSTRIVDSVERSPLAATEKRPRVNPFGTALSTFEKYLLLNLVSVRMMTRDQIQTLWYEKQTLRALNWRLRQVEGKKLIQRVEAKSLAQSVYTYTQRGLEALQAELAFDNLELGLDPPPVRQFKEFLLQHQLMVAETYVRLVADSIPQTQRKRMESLVWQDGSRMRISVSRGYRNRSLFPDAWLRTEFQVNWAVLLEVDRGTESGSVISETVKDYLHAFWSEPSQVQEACVVFVCPSETRKRFIQSIFHECQISESRFGDRFRAATINESRRTLDEHLVSGVKLIRRGA